MMPPSYHGLLVLDKPGGMTSRAVVDRALSWFPRGTRVGHTGTLDPLATGVLVLCIGAATRLAEYVQDMFKVYRARLRLGARSDSDDADGNITPVPVEQPPTRSQALRAVRSFIGEIDQVPPAFSATHVGGRRAYDMARTGREFSLEPRRVRIYDSDVLNYSFPRLDIEVRCGKGTYIRSLARDLGERLGCGALVETLRRERVGPFAIADAVTLDVDKETALGRLQPPSAALAELPRLALDRENATRLRHGQALALEEMPREGVQFAAFDPDGELIGVARLDRAEKRLRAVKVLHL